MENRRSPDRDCRDVRELFVPYLDREVTAAEASRVEAHVAACPDCGRELEIEREIGDALRTPLPAAAPRSDLAAEVRRMARRTERIERSLIYAASALAAALLIACALLWRGSSPTVEGPPAGDGRVAETIGIGTPLEESEDLIGALDALEALEEAGVEPTRAREVVQLLLDRLDDQWIPSGSEPLDPVLLDLLFESEVPPENL